MPATYDHHLPPPAARTGEDPFDKYVSLNKQRAAAEGRPYNVDLYQRQLINVFGIHIDTRNQDSFDKMHTNPRELARRIDGYRNLLEAGYPPERVLPCMTLTSAAAERRANRRRASPGRRAPAAIGPRRGGMPGSGPSAAM